MLEVLLLKANSFVTEFNLYAKDYPFIAGAFSVWVLGVMSYLMRNIPMRIWRFLAKHSTTKLTLISTHRAYHNFLRWLVINDYLKHARSFKITSGLFGSATKPTNSIGYGAHYFMYKCRPFKLTMEQRDTDSDRERDQITITILGRSSKFFNKIFEEISIIDKEVNNLSVAKYMKDYWCHIYGQRKRSIDKVFLNNRTKKEVIEHIDNFIENESWYVDNGLSYQTGILLYGPPGTGKTSFIKALATKYDKALHILSASQLIRLEKACMDLPEKSILLIEDIDSDQVLHDRENNESSSPTLFDSLTNLSDVLNSIDGVVNSHGRILIATTNHIEKLDGALLRSGRFDLKIKLDYADIDVVTQFFNNYYPKFKIGKDFELKDKVSPADVQNLILNNLEQPEKVLENLAK